MIEASRYMRKGVVFVLSSLLLLSVFIFFTTAQSQPSHQSTSDKGSNFERTCIGDKCNLVVFSYDKYFQRNGEWEQIDENWYPCGDNFCTKNYYFNATADSNGLIKMNIGNRQFRQQISTFRNLNVTLSSPTISGSVLTYTDVIPNIDLKYQYLPHKLKEEIVIKQPIENLSREDLHTLFTLAGDSLFSLEEPFICDSGRKCAPINYTLSDNQVSLVIPWRFLTSETTVYPVTIDPSFTLDNASIIWNGVAGTWSDGDIISQFRTNNPATLLVGAISGGNTRGDIDWNLDLVPDTGNINNATLSLFFENLTAPNYINITNMEKNSSQWPDDLQGNINFNKDMGNGTIYSNYTPTFNASNLFINFTFNQQGLDAFKNSLSTTKRFSTGISSNLALSLSISGRDNANSSRRPTFIISYDFSAIEKGINNSLPNNPISSDQQIYIVGLNGQHYLGRFDKTTTKNNQTWAFNYVVSGESFINMSSLFNIVNVWQNSSLNYSQIVSQVENFINNTRIP